MRRRLRLSTVSLVLGLSACRCGQPVPLPEPSDPGGVLNGPFPVQLLDQTLAEFVDTQGRVDYIGLKERRAPLERFLWAVRARSPQTHPDAFKTADEKLSYWINAYNAYVLYAITERTKLHSVGDHKVDFFYLTKYRFGEEVYSLYELENDIIRQRFDDPRIHMALNCASRGCPELPREAFHAARLSEQLDREARRFCAAARNIRVEGGKLQVSKIFEWYADDFKAIGGPAAFCRAHGRTGLPDVEMEFIAYDWSLNAQPGRSLAGPPSP